ncbi:MAG: carbohydrate ABC transporter permease [Halobacteriales archaeon]
MSDARISSVRARIADLTGFSYLENPRKLLWGLGLGVVLFLLLLPVYWAFLMSVRSSAEIFASQSNLVLDVFSLNWGNYSNVLFQRGFLGNIVNSLIIAAGNTILVLTLAVPAAYAFRLGLRGSKDVFFWILTNRMAPPAIFILPLFFLATNLNLNGTFVFLILSYCLFNLPFAIWLIHGIMQGIPQEIDEAVYVDGGTDIDVLWRVIIPLSKPGIAVSGLLVFLFAWNHYVFTILLTDTSTQTITNGLASFFTTTGVAWGNIGAATMLSMLPGLLLAVWVQKHIVTGLTFGAVKI